MLNSARNCEVPDKSNKEFTTKISLFVLPRFEELSANFSNENYFFYKFFL